MNECTNKFATKIGHEYLAEKIYIHKKYSNKLKNSYSIQHRGSAHEMERQTKCHRNA